MFTHTLDFNNKGRRSFNDKRGLLRLSGLVMIWVGLVFLWRGVDMFYIYFASGSWPVVQARVLSAEVVKIAHTRNQSTTGARGSFTYEYQGKKYTSTQIDISGGSNSNVADKEQKVAILQEALRNNESVNARVNPNDPSYAIIFREISQNMIWNMVFGLILTPLGFKIAKSLFFKAKPEQKA
jgi:lipopolysaccharide export LptBFGC system permease protein LptF